MTLHTLERQAEQLNDAGLEPAEPTDAGSATAPDVRWLIEQAPAAPRWPGRVVLLIPGASPGRPRKRWPAERYAALARGLSGPGSTVCILGGAGERETGALIAAAAPGARDLTGATTLAEVARLGSIAALAVGNDTGPMHLVAAAGAPCVALFSGDSDPRLCAPRGAVTILRRADLADLPVSEVQAAVSAVIEPRDAAAP
jgi:ADP-heptose:LPS heptosyltransferase